MMESSWSTSSPAPEWEYIWIGGEPLAQVEVSTGAVAYYVNDHLGAPLLQTSSTGEIIWRVEREPYGEIFTYRTGAPRHQPLGFPGQELDPYAPTLRYNVFRWYRAGWGRYSQADPIGLEGGTTYSGSSRGIRSIFLTRWV